MAKTGGKVESNRNKNNNGGKKKANNV